MKLKISAPEEILDTALTLPPSKSMGVRAAAMDAFSAQAAAWQPDGSADVDAMRRVAATRSGTADAGESAAALRFGMALLAATPGADVRITGTGRLMERPHDALTALLRSLGADVERDDEAIVVRGQSLDGGEISVEAGASSQYISALAMAAPLMRRGLVIKIDWNQPSLPYIDMTLAMMRNRGIDARREGNEITVRPGTYQAPAESDIEPDWSAAAFWYETAALTAGFVTLRGLSPRSVQGDSRVSEIFTRLGVVTAFDQEGAQLSADPEMHARLDYDCAPCPDLVPAMAVTAAMLGVPFELSGVGALRHKECDRLEAIVRELAKTGAVAEIDRDTLLWDGRRVPVMELPEFDAHGDHRMAMALAPVAVFAPGITIDGAECVAKSYPHYWDDMRAAGFEIEEVES